MESAGPSMNPPFHLEKHSQLALDRLDYTCPSNSCHGDERSPDSDVLSVSRWDFYFVSCDWCKVGLGVANNLSQTVCKEFSGSAVLTCSNALQRREIALTDP